MCNRACIIIVAVLFDAAILLAQTVPIVWSGEMRIRTEVDGRDLNSRTPPNVYTLSRARLAALIRPSEGVTVFLQMQDARIFGEEATTTTSLRALDLQQAYMKVDDLPFPGFSFRLGKMELAYGNGRLVSDNPFGNVPRSMSGLIGTLKLASTSIDLLLLDPKESNLPATVANRYAYTRDTGDRLAGVWTTTSAFPHHTIDAGLLYHTIQRKDGQARDSLSVLSLGVALKGSSGSLFYEGDGAVQQGASFGTTISTWQFGLFAGWNFAAGVAKSIGAGIDMYSGRKISSTSLTTFDPRFGAGHKNLGFMDYFINIPLQTSDRGIVDMFGRAEFTPIDGVNVQCTVHAFQLANSYTLAVPSNNLGTEFDCIVRWKPAPVFTLDFGACVMAPGTVLQAQYGGNDPGTWLYVSSQVNF